VPPLLISLVEGWRRRRPQRAAVPEGTAWSTFGWSTCGSVPVRCPN